MLLSDTGSRLHLPRQREVLNLVAGETADDAVDEANEAWGEAHTVRSWVIRDIVRGRLALDPDPRGLRLRGGRISGRLIGDGFEVIGTGARGAVCLVYAHLGQLDIVDAKISSVTGSRAHCRRSTGRRRRIPP